MPETLTIPTPPTTCEAGLLLSAADVGKLLGCGRSTVYRLLHAGALPRPVNLGNVQRWRRMEIVAWIAAGCPPAVRWEWEG